MFGSGSPTSALTYTHSPQRRHRAAHPLARQVETFVDVGGPPLRARSHQRRRHQQHLAVDAAAAVADLLQQLPPRGGLVGDDENPPSVVTRLRRRDFARLAPPGDAPDSSDADPDQQGRDENPPDRLGDERDRDHQGRRAHDHDYEAKYIRLGTKRVVHGPIVAAVTSTG
jgi:hypothetical protein